MTRVRLLPLVALPLVALLVACGQSTGPAAASPAPSPSPSSTGAPPTPSAPPEASALVVVVDSILATSGFSTASTTLRFLREDGSEAARQTLRPGIKVEGAAGNRVFLLETDRTIKTITSSGDVEPAGQLMQTHPEEAAFVLNPDGTRWLWSACCGAPQAVHMGGPGLSDSVVETANLQDRWLRPYVWRAYAAIVAHAGFGIGGYILYDAPFGPVDELNPDTGRVTALSLPAECAFSDVAGDGTVACIRQSSGPAGTVQLSLEIIHPGGATTTVQAPAGDRVGGEAFFSPDGKTLTFDTSPEIGSFSNPAAEQFHLRLVAVDSGAARAAGPANVQALFWLPDGSLVVRQPQLAPPSGGTGTGGPLYLVRPDGTYVQLSSGGTATGFVNS